MTQAAEPHSAAAAAVEDKLVEAAYPCIAVL